MAFVRGAALLVLALALAGCAVGGTEESDEITAEQLAIMVLPREEFEGGADLVLDTEDAGPVSAREAADSTVDLEDDASDVRQAGWSDGYELNYSVANRSAVLTKGQGLFGVGSSVDLYDTETSARAYLLNEIQAYERYRGKKRDDVRLVRFETFEVDIGDEGWGVEFIMRGQSTLHGTGVFFRSGRLVASVGYSRGDGATMRDEATKAGRALESRIERSLAGELDAEPVPVPGQAPEVSAAQLSKMTLSLKDLPTGAYLSDESRVKSKVSVGFYRTFDVESTMIGGSHLMFLRAGTLVYENAASAQLSMRYVSGPKGRSEFARGVLRDFQKHVGARPRNVRVAPMHRPGAGATGMVITFDLPTGRYRIATVLVRSGRALAVVSGFCTAHAVHPEDISPLGEKALRRLRTVPV
jgi:hypothetical protein